MEKAGVRVLQQCLCDEGCLSGATDGKPGQETYQAVQRALLKRRGELPDDWDGWPSSRKMLAYLQCVCREREIETGEIDGYWGPQTAFAYDSLLHLVKNGALPASWRDDTPLDANPHGWPRQNEADLNAFFGGVGENMVPLKLPYPHRYSWDLRQTIDAFPCNVRVRESALRVLTRVFDHYGMERIKEMRLDRWGGCVNVRKMRGGSKPSMHSWGIAIDYDPDRNQLKWGRDKAAFAQPEYEQWWRFWEEEGWVSLGRSCNYDWMHVQASRL